MNPHHCSKIKLQDCHQTHLTGQINISTLWGRHYGYNSLLAVMLHALGDNPVSIICMTHACGKVKICVIAIDFRLNIFY